MSQMSTLFVRWINLYVLFSGTHGQKCCQNPNPLMIKGTASVVDGKILGQKHIKELCQAEMIQHLKFTQLLASKMTICGPPAFYPRITFILLFGFVMEVFLCVFDDLNNACYVFNINNDFDCGTLPPAATDTTDPSPSVLAITNLNSTAVLLTEIKMATVAVIDNENEFDSGVVAIDTIQTGRIVSQTTIVYTNTDIGLAGNLVLGYVCHVDWQNAVWLGVNDDTNSVDHYFTNDFRLVFDLTSDEILDIKKVRIYVATPNHYKAWLNDDELLEERELGYFTIFEESGYYDVIDCTSYLTKNAKNAKNRNARKTTNNNNGATTISNAFGILGQRWYSQSSINIGVPMFKVLIYISFNNNTSPKIFTTDATNWYTHEGPVRMNDIYIGEHYDSNYETLGWEIVPKIERVEAFSPVTITQPADGVLVVDFGQNVAGFTKITIPGNNKNLNVTMIHSEQLYPNGTKRQIYSNSPIMDENDLKMTVQID